jgi:hypothetical protein
MVSSGVAKSANVARHVDKKVVLREYVPSDLNVQSEMTDTAQEQFLLQLRRQHSLICPANLIVPLQLLAGSYEELSLRSQWYNMWSPTMATQSDQQPSAKWELVQKVFWN